MNNLFSFFTMLMVVTCFASACHKNAKEEITAVPFVETLEVTFITARSALSGGNITNDSGKAIIARGVCWNTDPTPTVTDSHTTDASESANFLCTLSDLIPGATYYVRAFAANDNGTGYGAERSFTTRNDDNDDGGNLGDPSQTQTVLWDGNMPATTSRESVANSSNPDGPDFRPYMVHFPAKEGVGVKGAVLICAGGAFQFRSDANEGTPVARALSELGYQSFVVNYRLRPYTQQEGALDLARAVRFVRTHADYYGIQDDDIAIAGFSAGGILCGEMALNYRGTVNGSSLDSRYVPDELDNVYADVKAIGHIYSFYGRLSVASTDVELFRRSNLPPAFFCYGTNDPFANQFAACINALRQANVPVETHVLQGWPHGYGYRGDWIPVLDQWLTDIFNQ